MILINKDITDLVSGFDLIMQAESMLRRRWRQPLLLAYARRREIHEAELSRYRSRSVEFRRRFRIGIWLSSVLLILGAVAFPALILLGELGSLRGPLLCFAPILILAGLNGWAILGMLWMWQKERRKPTPPPNPLEQKITDQLFSEWRMGLQGDLPIRKREEDSSGAYHFIARLLPLDDASYLVYRLQVDETTDVDIFIVGPKGIWVFEVVNFTGVIQWKDGVWTRSRGVHRLQKADQIEIARNNQSFEKVWSHKADQVAEIILSEIPDVVARNPKSSRVRGGLVFTHPQARFVIPPGVPFNWGVPKFWLDKLRGIPAIPALDERTSLQFLEALLRHHQELTNPSQTRSMLQSADELVRKSENEMKSWIAEL